MSKPKISIIVAMDEKRGIGKKNEMMWHISDELKRFRKITTPHPIIMGRKTHESIGKALPNRTNIIVTRDPHAKYEGCLTANSLVEALELAKKADSEEIFIIGGGEIYKQALPLADKLYLTLVQGDFGATVFFPDYSDFQVTSESDWQKSENQKYKFLVLEK